MFCAAQKHRCRAAGICGLQASTSPPLCFFSSFGHQMAFWKRSQHQFPAPKLPCAIPNCPPSLPALCSLPSLWGLSGGQTCMILAKLSISLRSASSSRQHGSKGGTGWHVRSPQHEAWPEAAVLIQLRVLREPPAAFRTRSEPPAWGAGAPKPCRCAQHTFLPHTHPHITPHTQTKTRDVGMCPARRLREHQGKTRRQ